MAKKDARGNDQLEAALDGLLAATNYCEANGMDELSREIADLYQRVGQESPDEHWEDIPEDATLEEILGDE